MRKEEKFSSRKHGCFKILYKFHKSALHIIQLARTQKIIVLIGVLIGDSIAQILVFIYVHKLE